MADLVNREVKKNSYASKSEFFRSLIRNWSEKQIVDEILESQKEIRKTGGTLLKSLRDLR
jgi:Arc/MetJ-type ribon-helix-helix transcriptional regulator